MSVKVDHMGRYSENLQSLLDRLGAFKILRESFCDDYQGDVDVDVLLEDGRVFSYCYSYGSCSGCDTWEAQGLDDAGVEAAMEQGATFFDSMRDYNCFINRARLKKVLRGE